MRRYDVVKKVVHYIGPNPAGQRAVNLSQKVNLDVRRQAFYNEGF